jgi:hypothetical protein
MISSKTLSQLILLLAATGSAQLFNANPRPPGAFTNIQPADTVILNQYNDSEPVYPSREFGSNLS